MEFLCRAANTPARLGVFPGSFNPPTVAHLALANAALNAVDEVVFVLPRSFPHKEYSGTTLEQRAELLREAVADEPRFSAAISEGGLFIEIARECRADYGDGLALSFLCGRDAAERIASWDYGSSEVWPEMLKQFDLLVAPRAGEYTPHPDQLGSFRQIAVAPGCDLISATEVRRRIESGEPWQHLVPEAIRAGVRKFYSHPAR
jgi:nicotinate (nicotinamide) nucleotide adenylyltransferase